MYCQGCGKEVAEDAVICLGCGREIKKSVKPWSVPLLIVYTLISFLIPYIGLTIGLIGVSKEPTRGQGACVLAVSAICIVPWTRYFFA